MQVQQLLSQQALVEGIQAQIEVKDENGIVLYTKHCPSKLDVENFVKQYGKSREGWSLIKGVLMPLRTDNGKDFAKDLFLPTFFIYALRINNLAVKIFVSIAAILFDILTFPVRLVVSPFRALYNHYNPHEEHPIIQLIKGSPNAQQAMSNNLVVIDYEVTEVNFGTPESNPDSTEVLYKASVVKTTGLINVVLKTTPGGITYESSEQTFIGDLISIDNLAWTAENYTFDFTSHYLFTC